MGVTKSYAFTEEQNAIAGIARALAHPARVAILQHLASTQSCICGDLVDVLPLSQATVSQHLRELKDAGLIRGEIEGTRKCYCLDPDVWSRAFDTLELLFGPVRSVTKCC